MTSTAASSSSPPTPATYAAWTSDMTDTPTTTPDDNGPGDDIQPIQLQDEMERSFIDYAMSVIMSRALPDVRDGLKPVHRRIIWDMDQQGFRPNRAHVKSA